MKSVIVVGAGLTGLTLTYALEKLGHEVTLFECAETVGGALQSEQSAKYLLEWGANSALLTPALKALCAELALQNEIIYPSLEAKHRFLARKGSSGELRLAPLPKSPAAFVTSDAISPRAKMKIFAEPFLKSKHSEDQSIRSFVASRFGEELAGGPLSAALNGVWAGDVTRLSARSVMPKSWDAIAQGKSIVTSAVARGIKSRENAKVFSFNAGMQSLPAALQRGIKRSQIILSAMVDSIQVTPEWVKVRAGALERSADFVCLTSGAKPCARLLGTAVPDLAVDIDAIRYAPLGVLHLSYDKTSVQHPLDGFGCLLPAELLTALLGAIFSSSLFPGRAPATEHLLTCFTGGMTKPQFANATQPVVQEMVRMEMSQLIGAQGKPRVTGARYLPAAIPNYEIGHHRLVERVNEFNSSDSGIKICANWLDGISVSARVERALAFADRIHAMS